MHAAICYYIGIICFISMPLVAKLIIIQSGIFVTIIQDSGQAEDSNQSE